ncbi:hypothetical protein V6N13_051904 [Hibiscus sabdariffa]|uniref:Uncharacterized protein n=1 Tax=Hibiscus sabdariffa TaxID=183260 RepID=A0ABR2T5S7_9ROSI
MHEVVGCGLILNSAKKLIYRSPVLNGIVDALKDYIQGMGGVGKMTAALELASCFIREPHNGLLLVSRSNLQYYIDIATSRWPGLWDPQTQLWRAVRGAEGYSWGKPRHLQSARSRWI